MFNRLAATLRELAAVYWREGNHLQASALHMRAILLEAGCPDEQPQQPTEARSASMEDIRAAMLAAEIEMTGRQP